MKLVGFDYACSRVWFVRRDVSSDSRMRGEVACKKFVGCVEQSSNGVSIYGWVETSSAARSANIWMGDAGLIRFCERGW